MSLPWLRDDYKRPESRSRSRSSSGSRGRQRNEAGRNRRSRSRSSPRGENRDWTPRGRDGARGRGGGRRGGNDRSPERSRRKRSRSSSSASSEDSQRSATRLVASSRPKYVNARIFVANITSKEVTKAEIVAHFEKYGNVVDCLIHPKNYIFVQYLKEEHARLAVEGENGSTFCGFRIDVKMANENRKTGGQQNRDRRGEHNHNNDPPGRPIRDRERDRDPYGPDPFGHDRRQPPPFPPPPGGDFGMRDPYFPPDPYRRGYPPDPWMPPDDPYRRDPYGDPYRDPYAARPPLPPPPPAAPIGPVECEVFIVNPQLRTYGEIIERKVKDQSIITSLSIIPEGRTAPQMVEELTIKGGLFAIFLNAQNEVHRSLTLNILHGTPQEHRNMPMDDAISLVGRSFEKYVEDLRAKANASSTASASTSGGGSRVFLPPTSEVTYLLNLLADNRALTVSELDTVIKYLQERRDKLIDADKRPVIKDDDKGESERKYAELKSSESKKKTESKQESDTQSTHDELTKKILSIFQGVDPAVASKLSQSSGSVAQVPAPKPAPPPPPEKPSSSGKAGSGSRSNIINFDNPNVQEALNNLIQSGPDLLKSFTSSNSEPNPPVSSSIVSSQINLAPPLSSTGPEMMGNSNQGIPSSLAGGMGMAMQGTDMNTAMAMSAMGMQMQSNEMGMAMFGPGQQFDSNMAALAAASMAAYNMPGMGQMGGQEYNFSPMPMGGPGGPPLPPPRNQRF